MKLRYTLRTSAFLLLAAVASLLFPACSGITPQAKMDTLVPAKDSVVRGLTYQGFVALTPLDSAQSVFLPQMWTLWKAEKWNTLDTFITTKELNGNYPPAAGFVNVDTVTLAVETKLDRYGGLWGSFVAPQGAPFTQRSLPPASINSVYYQFKVIKAIPGILAGKAIPWFGQEGMGMQYKFPSSVQTMIDNKYLMITDSVPAKPAN